MSRSGGWRRDPLADESTVALATLGLRPIAERVLCSPRKQ